MNSYLYLFLAFALIYLFFLVRFFLRAQKPTDSTVEAYVGGLGTGKTFLAVKRAVSIYKRNLIRYKIYKFFNRKTKLKEPQLISNIPIKINKKRWSVKLKPEHLLMKLHIPENSVVLMDEVGNIISQHDFNNPISRHYILPFFRLFRHWVDGKLIITDQASGSILIAVRRRLNVLYNLSKLSTRLFGKVYKINYFELIISEDAQSVVNSNELNKNYFAGFFGRFKRYESRTFKFTYPALKAPISTDYYNNYFTDYAIDFSVARDIKLTLSHEEQLQAIKRQLENNEYLQRLN